MPQRGIAAVALALSISLVPAAAQTAGPAAGPPTGAPPPDLPKIELSTREVPATGRQVGVVSVDRWGRYAVRTESPQGTALEVVDRMAGSLGRSGEAGRENGRLDLLLDRGQYRLIATSHDKGTGKARFTVQAFREVQPGIPPRLPETRLLSESLDDLEQRSWWLEVGTRREVRAEAAGRSLADLRLWRDGSWLEGAQPECTVIQPVTGRPLLRCRLTAVLAPGLYRLTAYGGPGQPWAEAGDEHPLHVRWGAPSLPAAGRRRFVVSPFGEDWYRLPDAVNFVRLELPEARPAGLSFRWLQAGESATAEGTVASAEVTKETSPPVAELVAPDKPEPEEVGDSGEGRTAAYEEEGSDEGDESYEEESYEEEESGDEESADEESYDEEGGEGEDEPSEDAVEEEPAPAPDPGEPLAPELWVAVSGAPGQAYVLQQLEQRDVYSFSQEGPHWISTVHSGDPEDSVDATALLTDSPPVGREQVVAAAAINLGANASWSRRFNLLEPVTLFLEVKDAGRYRVVLTGAAAAGIRMRIEPFFVVRPERYEPPRPQGATSQWDLDAGLFVLTLEPASQGIVDLALGPANGPAPSAQPVRGAARFAPVSLDATHRYTVHLNTQPGVQAGVVLRPWPVDLGEALPVVQRPGEEVTLPFTSAFSGTLRAEAEDGSRLEVALDGAPWATEAAVAPGAHQVAVRPAPENADKTVSYSLWVEPLEAQAATPLPPLPDATLAALPRFPVLATGAPRFLDLDRGESATFLVQADRPGLYAVRSTGLLATAGTLRTRTVPSLRREEGNGVGRNFLVQQYLREGDYQATVRTVGASRGHLGVALEAVPLLDGGTLREGLPGHFTLPAGQAVAYRFTVAEAGTYRLRALGLGFTFRGRLEDADGWPLERPDREIDLTRRFEPGSYRIVLLPQPVEARALLLLERRREPPAFSGHGPHPLPLEQTVEHVWTEPTPPAEGSAEASESERAPDLWRFEIPAEVRATVALTEEMEGRLVRLDGSGETEANETEIGTVPPGRAWTGALAPGSYQLAARCFRRNNLVRYQVSVGLEELVAGQSRAVTAPSTVPLAVGREGLFEISSFAEADVRATLRDADGWPLATADDRPDGWTFLLSQRLAPGRYQLDIQPVGADSAPVTVALRAPAEVAEAALPLPFQGDVQLSEDVQLRPLPVPDKADLLLVAVKAKDSLGLSVEARTGDGWTTLGTAIAREPALAVPLERVERGGSRSELRLRLWSLDRQGTPARLYAAAVAAPRLDEGDLRKGAVLPQVAGFPTGWGAARVSLDRPGVLALTTSAPLSGSGTTGLALTPLPTDAGEPALLAVPGSTAWLVASGQSGKKGAPVKAARVVVPPGLDGGTRVPLPAGRTATCDLETPDGQSGPVLALATAPAGQPGVTLTERGDLDEKGATNLPSAAALAVASRTALAVALDPRRPAAQVWSAGPAETADEVLLRQVRFPAPAAASLAWGVTDGRLAGTTARRLDLPDGATGARTLRLSLGEATVAVLSRGDAVLSVHWQGGAPFEERLDPGAADRLTLLHTGAAETEQPYTVELLASATTAEALRLAPTAPFERALDRAGTLRLALPPISGSASTVHVRGAGAEALLLGRDGSILRGSDLPAGQGGTLLIRHQPGLLLTWMGAEGESTAALWPAGSATNVAPTQVTPPTTVALTGPAVRLAIASTAPRVLHLRTASPIVTLLRRGAGLPEEVEVHSESGRLDVYLPAGEALLGLRALAGAPLSGGAELTVTPVTAIGEGLGPEVLVPAGGARWFSFEVTRSGPIGAGVHADSDRVEIELYDASGRPLVGTAASHGGVVRMPDLAPGTYLLALRSPADAPPVPARPALAGLALPDTGPPAEVIQQYLEQAGAEDAAPETESEDSGSAP